MFWGLIMEPQRRYTQTVKKAFHISMAAIDISTSSDEPAQVMCSFEGRNYLLCTLKKPDVMQVPLDLNFNVGNELSFAANGKCHVHLTGYLLDEIPELTEEENEEEEEEEIEQDEDVKKKKNKKRGSKENLKNGPPSKKSKSKTKDEDEDSSDSDLDVKALLENTLEDDEDDPSFAGVEEEEEEEDDDESGGEEEEESDAEDEEAEDEEVSSMSDSDQESQPPKNENAAKINGVPHKKKKKQQQPSTPTPNKENKDVKTPKKVKENQSPKELKKGKTPEKASQSPKKKQLQGGVIIEDIREGQGPNAKNGKFVTVYYEGRLKQNNKVFDSTNKGNGFSFRLGNAEVIKGWDVGVAGMKVGGKRRIICPPEMAYGAKGSPPAIPANSTLVFDVEMRKIR